MNRKILKALCLAGVLTSSSIFADGETAANDVGSSKDKQMSCGKAMLPPDGPLNTQAPGSYNMPACVNVAGWDFAVDASFIYWYASQDYMDVAQTAQYNVAGARNPPMATLAQHQFKYKPGFKAGFEFTTSDDDWVVKGSYLWLHETTTSKFGFTPSAMTAGQDVFILSDWFNTRSSAAQSPQVNSKWKLHMDMADLLFSRPLYQGRKLIVNPYGGIRALWMRQAFNIKAVDSSALTVSPAKSVNQSQSWAVGATSGAEVRYLMRYGFRFQGDMGLSLLFTRYTKRVHLERDGANNGDGETTSRPGTLPHLSTVRPIAQMGLGMGWGSYFGNNGYHIDLSANYDFMVLWNQNMMREVVGDLQSTGYSSPQGNLNLQGLTVNASLDF